MPLTQIMCESAKPGPKDRKLTDGGGLYLLIRVGGTKTWRFGFMRQGKSRTITIGRFPDVTLKQARTERDRIKKNLSLGLPIDANIGAGNSPKFADMATEWFERQVPSWSRRYAATIWSRVEADLLSALGHRPIDEIEPREILGCLRKIEDRGAIESAKRVNQYASSIFRYAVASGLATRDPTADLRGALMKKPPVKHRSALKSADLPEFFAALREYQGEPRTALLLEIVLHTFVRTQEIRLATWDEIKGDTWRIPAAHMKMKAEHVVPLSRQTQALFAELRKHSTGTRVAPVSYNTLIYAMYRMGYHSRATVHGFRGTASTILNESGLWSPDAIERQLAHVEGNAVRRAYNSAQYLPERRKMMQWWSDYLEDMELSGGLLG